MDKREFAKGLLATVSSFCLIESLFTYQAFGKEINPIINHWAIQLNEFCMDLKTESISAVQWQFQMEKLYQQVELEAILQFIEFDKLIKGFEYPELGVNTKRVKFPKLSGLPEQTVFVKKIFGMKKGRAIIPHGHSNMASAHLILQGDMHIRHYEKVHQEEKSLIIKPTVDRTAHVGDSSSISDEKENIHWFIANSETAFTFDIILLDLNQAAYAIHNVDIYEKEDLHDGTMRVPILAVDTALKKYGKHHH